MASEDLEYSEWIISYFMIYICPLWIFKDSVNVLYLHEKEQIEL